MSKLKSAEALAKDYDFQTESDYFDYIIESMRNGQRQQTKSLFMQMIDYDKKEFLTNYLDVTPGQIGKSVLNTCLDALLD